MLSYTTPAVSPAEAGAYAVARAWTNWTGEDAAKEAALRRGQDYIGQRFNARWATDWANDAAPDLVKYAIIEAARRELVAPGSLAPDFVASKTVTREKKRVGPLEKELEYAGATNAGSVRPVISAIDNLLAGLLKAAGGASVDLLRV